ncbi:MAG: cobalamin biosynthesis protein CobD [Oscillospiraceae bacterium]|nr:cobalamin biosynthesis protein CobD [Oscillospiraceae bacterium]
MSIVCAAVCAFALDLLFGDPSRIPHSVVWMGRYITVAEKFLRAHFPERIGGVILAASLPALTFAVSFGLCRLAAKINPFTLFALQTFWGWQSLALKGLADESRNVYAQLVKPDLPGARKAAARIVGRDTQRLDERGVIRAAVESVAENFSDGVAAPLLYFFIGGAPLALAYKAVNTMDSMVGYKNERFLNFGRAAAKLDDAANYIPSRIAAVFWILAAAIAKQDAKSAFRIWRRDRRKHASPNAAQTESACAGALGIRLGGPAHYFGEYCDKPYLGDATREPEAADILRTNRMLYAAGVLLLAALSFLFFGRRI